MTTEKHQKWLPVALIAGALIAWMGLLAAGAYWAPVGLAEDGATGSANSGDFRKLWVVAATTGGFLLLWGFVLIRVQGKLRRQKSDREQAKPNSDESP